MHVPESYVQAGGARDGGGDGGGARLYTFHSFRSGLATALHAAGVSDDMIQLICRWMCPESLRTSTAAWAPEREHGRPHAATSYPGMVASRVDAVPGSGRMLPSAALFERFNLSDVV